MNKSTLSKVSIFSAALVALNSIGPWYSWNRSYLTLFFLFVLLVSRFFISTYRYSKTIYSQLYCCVILYIYIYWFNCTSYDQIITTTFTRILPVCFVITFSKVEKRQFVNLFTNIFTGIHAISLVFFTLWMFDIPLPSTAIRHPNDFYPEFNNYYAFLVADDLDLFTRFRGILTEPGHLGMICSILLYVNGYNYKKWQTWILTLSLFWSLSLAGYILFAVGIYMYKLLTNKKQLRFVAASSVVLILLLIAGVSVYNNYSDSVVSKLILSRLEIDSDGNMAGNNRHSSDFETAYDQFIKSPQSITGVGLKTYNSYPFASGGNSSYKNFIFQYGYLGILLLIVFEISLVCSTKSKLYWGLLVLYACSFIQRPYALWEVEAFTFICYAGCIPEISKT